MKLKELVGGECGWIGQAVTAIGHGNIIGRGAGKYKLTGPFNPGGTPKAGRRSGTNGLLVENGTVI